MDYEALNVCHVCQQGKDLKVVNELPSCFLAAFDFEREDGSSSVGEVLLVQLVVGMVGQAGMVNLGNMGSGGIQQPFWCFPHGGLRAGKAFQCPAEGSMH